MEENFRRVPPPPPPRPNIPTPPQSAEQITPHVQSRQETIAPAYQPTPTAEPVKKEKNGVSPALALTLKIAGAIVSLGLAVFFIYMLVA